jgi:hypothetical protein
MLDDLNKTIIRRALGAVLVLAALGAVAVVAWVVA